MPLWVDLAPPLRSASRRRTAAIGAAPAAVVASCLVEVILSYDLLATKPGAMEGR